MQIVLKIKANKSEKELVINTNDIIVVGRSRSCDIQTDDEKTSARHSRFFLKPDRLEIYDLDSKNGTYLNGIRIDRSEVFVGDEIRIGDCLLIFEDKNMDKEAIDVFTFPGPFKERISYELKADFTGARIQNQINAKNPILPKIKFNAHEKEISCRKKINSGLRISKQEIRLQNAFLSFVSTLIDALALVIVTGLPIYFSGKIFPQELLMEQRTFLLGALVTLMAVLFFILNYKKTRFSLGERISGIKELYEKQ